MPKHDFSMTAAALAQMLARQAEAVCRHYLPAGRREGRYWLVGDVHNTPGRSSFVRLTGGSAGKGAAGRPILRGAVFCECRRKECAQPRWELMPRASFRLCR